jgi:hypothetical protein
MRSVTPHFRRALVAIGATAALTLGAALPVLADSSTGTATVTGGSLTSSTPSSFTASATTLDGTDKTATYTLPITVTDATGSGAGWNFTVTSTTFTTGGGSPHTLADNASTMTAVTAFCAASTTCTNPSNSIGYPMTLPGASATAVKMFNAAANTGMGKFTVTPSVSIAIPASTYAGTYTSTLTLSLTSAP